jgi:hypothetical protein
MPLDVDPPFEFTRRRILAAVAGGALLSSGTAVAMGDGVSYNRHEQLPTQVDGVELRVDWKEWYNGAVLERQDTPVDRSGAQPLIALPGVLPGDSGRVAIGLSTAAEEGQSPPVEVRLRVREFPDEREENGRSEPERKANDTTPNVGELQEHLDVVVWYDSGITVNGSPIYGECDANLGIGDTELASGTLVDVASPDALGEWQVLDATPKNDPDQNPCLRPNENMCLGLQWTVPEEVSNVIQGDSVSFAVDFAVRQCQ